MPFINEIPSEKTRHVMIPPPGGSVVECIREVIGIFCLELYIYAISEEENVKGLTCLNIFVRQSEVSELH